MSELRKIVEHAAVHARSQAAIYRARTCPTGRGASHDLTLHWAGRASALEDVLTSMDTLDREEAEKARRYRRPVMGGIWGQLDRII